MFGDGMFYSILDSQSTIRTLTWKIIVQIWLSMILLMGKFINERV